MTAIITNIGDARHQANIAAKADALFGELGYRYKQFATCSTMFFVYPPQVEKAPYIVDVEAGTCTCPGHADAGTCSHALAMRDEAVWIASVEAREQPVDALN